MKVDLVKPLIPIGVVTQFLAGCSEKPSSDGTKPDTVPTSKPNIVFILADDMGYGDISALNTASAIKTPNLDRLCREGMRFSEAHACSAISTASRYGILTGRYCFRGPMDHGIISGYGNPLIETDRPTMASVLKKAGYRTGISGKWHLGLGWTTSGGSASGTTTDFSAPLTYSPNDIGFDFSAVLPASLDMPPYVCVLNHVVEDPEMVDEEGVYPADYRGHMWRGGKRSKSFDIQNTLAYFTGKALAFIRESSGRGKPFFIYMPLTAPHTPWAPTAEFRGKSGAGDYGDFVLNVDDVVGQVYSLLTELGVLENTIIVFSSDNGADWSKDDKSTWNHLANYIWRGRKSDVWDAGHHIPLIVRYPGVVTSASKSEAPVCLTDLMTTFAEIAGSKVPYGSAEDSQSFLPVLNGSKPKGVRTSMVHQSNDGSLAIREGRWKYIDCSGSGGWSQAHSDQLPQCQLYDMVTNPGETDNLYQTYPDKVTELKNKLDNIVTGK